MLKAYQSTGGTVGTDEQNNAFNAWAQKAITASGSQNGIAGIPDNFNPTTNTPNAPGTPPTLQSQELPPLNTLGGNYATSQVGGQTGGYQSAGSTTQTQAGDQTTNTSGTQNTGTNTNSVTQQNNTTNSSGGTTNKSTVDTPFDLGALVNSQLGSAGTADANRTGFLTDLMKTGGTALNSQVDQAVRSSLSGPQMSGAGDSAQARAAGYAGAQIARNNTGDRLNAASQLAGPTATNQTISTFSPLFGKTDTSTNTGTSNTAGTSYTSGNSMGTTNSTGTSNTLDLQKLVGNETGSGTATGQSSQQAGGIVPQGQPVQSGGCVVCTAFVSHGLMKPGAVRRACRYKQANWSRYGTSLSGYLLYGPFIARAVLYNKPTRTLVRPLARAVLYHEVHLAAPKRVKWKLGAWVAHTLFDSVSYPVGLLRRLFSKYTGVTNPTIAKLLIDQNLNFRLP